MISVKKLLVCFFICFFFSCKDNTSKKLENWKEPITGMEFVHIPKGVFLMGSTANKNEKIHEVYISHDFWLGKFEVTQEQWNKIMGDKELHPEKPSPFKTDNLKYPVVSISYYDVQLFLKKLEKLSKGNKFRLPTEAEWEYACRAGSNTIFNTGNDISDKLANFKATQKTEFSPKGNYIGHPTQVGSYPANSWGLYDMHGNVWEWISDWYAPYSSEKVINPKGPLSGTTKVIRGGSWYFNAENAQSSFRKEHYPTTWGFSIGFRVVRENIENN